LFGVDSPAVEAALRAYVKLVRAARAVSDRAEPRLAAAGLTATQLGVLEAVLHLGPLSQRDLGHKVLTSPGNMTDVVDKLAARGLVRRLCPADRRSRLVELTDAGRKLIEQVFPPHAADIAASFAALTADELATLDALLRKLGLDPAAPRPTCTGNHSISNDRRAP